MRKNNMPASSKISNLAFIRLKNGGPLKINENCGVKSASQQFVLKTPKIKNENFTNPQIGIHSPSQLKRQFPTPPHQRSENIQDQDFSRVKPQNQYQKLTKRNSETTKKIEKIKKNVHMKEDLVIEQFSSSMDQKLKKITSIQKERRQLETDLGFMLNNQIIDQQKKNKQILNQINNMSHQISNKTQISKICKQLITHFGNNLDETPSSHYEKKRKQNQNLLKILMKESELIKQIKNKAINRNLHTSQNQERKEKFVNQPIQEKDLSQGTFRKVSRKIKLKILNKIKLLQRLQGFIQITSSTVFNFDLHDFKKILTELQQISLIGHMCNNFLIQSERIRWQMLSTLLYIQAYQEIMRLFFVVSSSQGSENHLFNYLQQLAQIQIQRLPQQGQEHEKDYQQIEITQLQIIIYECKKIWENIVYMISACELQGFIPDQIQACLKDFRVQNSLIWQNFGQSKGKFNGNFLSFEKEVVKESKNFVKDILKIVSKKQFVSKYHFCLCKTLGAVFTVQKRYWIRRNKKCDSANQRIPQSFLANLESISQQMRCLQCSDQKLAQKTKKILKTYKLLADNTK